MLQLPRPVHTSNHPAHIDPSHSPHVYRPAKAPVASSKIDAPELCEGTCAFRHHAKATDHRSRRKSASSHPATARIRSHTTHASHQTLPPFRSQHRQRK